MRWSLLVALLLPGMVSSQNLYDTHCASCHGADRLGGIGPALLPENLSRLKQPEAEQDDSREQARRADACIPKRILRASRFGAGRAHLLSGSAGAEVGRSRDPRLARRAPCAGHAAGQAAVRRRSDESLRRGRGGRPPRHHPRRRPARADPPLRLALRAARRAEVHARRALRLSSPRATAGSPSSTCGTSRPWPRCAPASTRATPRCPPTAST